MEAAQAVGVMEEESGLRLKESDGVSWRRYGGKQKDVHEKAT